MNKTNKPKLFFCVGLVASGKSSWAENNKDKLNAVIHSSDAIREEFGDINDQTQNELVFNTLHKRVKEDLLNGNNVIYDATNLSRKRRVAFIKELKNIPCEKICVLFATPFLSCRINNAERERQVPTNVLYKMIKNFEVPCYQEGWDDIQIVWFDYKEHKLNFNFLKDLENWREISQDNPHHSLSIGDHMIAASNHYASMCEYYEDRSTADKLLSMAIFMHDCGKVFTKSFIDSKGNPCEKAHFYQHHLVGSYLSLFYLKESGLFTDNEILHISLLIGLHMQPFLAWDKSEKAKEKDRRLFGDNILAQVETLHICDLAAH